MKMKMRKKKLKETKFTFLDLDMYPFLSCFEINSHIFSLSSLNNRYIFLFFDVNPFFVSIV